MLNAAPMVRFTHFLLLLCLTGLAIQAPTFAGAVWHNPDQAHVQMHLNAESHHHDEHGQPVMGDSTDALFHLSCDISPMWLAGAEALPAADPLVPIAIPRRNLEFSLPPPPDRLLRPPRRLV